MISYEISWWDVSVVQVIQVIQRIQVMQVRLAQLWPDFRVIWYSTKKISSNCASANVLDPPWKKQSWLARRSPMRDRPFGTKGRSLWWWCHWRLQSGYANDDIASPSPMQGRPFGTRGRPLWWWCKYGEDYKNGYANDDIARRSPIVLLGQEVGARAMDTFWVKLWKCLEGPIFPKWGYPYFDCSQCLDINLCRQGKP